ncbi:MAG TPA: hypothetical protein DCR14_14695 [Acidimicrobiaceae bacterium]|nr:hypothetical protein [Acidimicrobiaceae bacterium]
MSAAIRRGWNVAAVFALVAAVGSCSLVEPAPSRRPITEEEFYEYVVGHTIFRSEAGEGYVGIGGDPPMVGGFDGCNDFSGPLVFSDGEVVFPEEGLMGTELACPGVELGTGGSPFGMWMVEPDGSLVVIATLDGSEQVVPDITVPNA